MLIRIASWKEVSGKKGELKRVVSLVVERR